MIEIYLYGIDQYYVLLLKLNTNKIINAIFSEKIISIYYYTEGKINKLYNNIKKTL